MTLRYYAIRIRPIHRLEFSVMHALNQRERPAIVPYEEKLVKKPRSKRLWDKRKFPLFPCYVFAGFDSFGDFLITRASINERAEAMGKAPPIVGVVGYGSRPAVLTPDDVAFLQSITPSTLARTNIHKALQIGGAARIVDAHPLGGQIVTVTAVARKRVTVMLKMLGGMMPVEIDPASLVAA